MPLRRRRTDTSVHLDMTPMVDVMMLLVIFFMMSTTFILTHPGFAINLPKAAAASEQPPESIIVMISKDAQLAVGDKNVSLEELKPLLAAAAGKQPIVYIKADKDVRHGIVVEVMDEIRKTGIVKMSLAVEAKGI